MKPRTLVFNLKDIVLNYEDVARTITDACYRNGAGYRVGGVCQNNDTIFFPMEPRSNGNTFRYVFAPFSGQSNDHIEADIFTRWGAGFATKGLIRLSESYLGLFEFEIRDDNNT